LPEREQHLRRVAVGLDPPRLLTAPLEEEGDPAQGVDGLDRHVLTVCRLPRARPPSWARSGREARHTLAGMSSDVRAARLRDLDPLTLYALLRLRTDVFVVEQECPYPELDGRDAEPATEHLWLEADGAPVATLRLLRDGEGAAYRIG